MINCLNQRDSSAGKSTVSLGEEVKKKETDVSTSNLLFIVAMDSIERMLQVKFFLIHAGHTSLGSL